MSYEILVKIACVLWPVLKPELKKLVQDTNSPIDDWVIVLLEAFFDKLCKRNAD